MNPVAKDLAGADFSGPTKDCDMVMKGGITSGVIYPLAVCHLGQKYRLRNIGGASAGAIAAGAAAAAEYGRDNGGYGRLAEIPSQVGGILDRLFQPTKSTRPAMRVLLAAVEPRRTSRRILGTLLALLRWRVLWFLLGFLLVAGIVVAGSALTSDLSWTTALRSSLVPIVLLAIPAGVAAAALGLVLVVLREAPKNYFGLASGMTTDSGQGDALTPWMHTQFQYVAGRSVADPPLTFGDLWGEAATADWMDEGPASAERLINLEMTTTNLTEGMPYRIPFEGNRFAYCPRCFGDLFPKPVVDHMEQVTIAAEVGDDNTAECRRHGAPVVLRRLPSAPYFPVVVAVRMSLSFPVLISAVPLYKRDFNRSAGKRNWVCHWFSDGGIGSNFPIHFFDSPWPMRPTFGIDLQPTHPDFPNSEFYRRKQGRRAQPRTLAMDSLVGFLSRILHTMQNWRDDSLAQSPGYSDRIVRIFQRADEGGLNLKMPAELVERLAARGGLAAAEFDSFDLEYHRWERYRIAMAELDVLMTDLHSRYVDADPTGEIPFADFVASHTTTSYVPNQGWRTKDQEHTQALMDVAAAWIGDGNTARHSAPAPSPVFRLESRQIESR